MIDTQGYLALIRGERRGPLAAVARGGLFAASGLFRIGVAARGGCFAAGLLRVRRAPLPVISIGNLTAGGTGKTPVVIQVLRRLLATGERPAVLARGYGAARDGELNDELRLIGEEVPGALLFPGKDRVSRARDAAAAGATVIVLDDGFQHRRLARDLDVVVLDATAPWGTPSGRLLPRGLLREPPGALRRADVVILNRVNLVGSTTLRLLEAEVRTRGFTGPLLRMDVEPRALSAMAAPAELGGDPVRPVVPGVNLPLASLRGAPLLAACGIGNPNAFAATLALLGGRTSQLVALPDHHDYAPPDVAALEELAARRAVPWVVVTAKDAVKLRPLLEAAHARGERRRSAWLSLEVEAAIEPREVLFEELAKALTRRRDGVPALPLREVGPGGAGG